MDTAAKKALNLIRRCVAAGRFKLLEHFTRRMDERGLFWPDVLAVIERPADVRNGGPEKWGRPKWIVAGQSAAGDNLELVCVLDTDEHGNLTLFITMY
jgi:hypothetical protein